MLIFSMDFSYIIFLLTFLIFPLIALAISRKVEVKRYWNILRNSIGIFLMHNAFFYLGYSLSGDYGDYVIFSLEYLAFCLLVFSTISNGKLLVKVLRILGIAIVSFGVFVGCIGIVMFIVIAQDYETDKKYHFESLGRTYEVRRYSFGFATMDDTRYTYETYKTFKYFSIERKIDLTDFFALKTELNIYDDGLIIYIVKNGNTENLVFKSSNGKMFSKKLN